ncbi:unnamed protein product [Cylicostephanus goldi]|uniref:SH2 domain-containing protein n=1 Tax=Cylicostephanus goldi TaxID=71465 RepID=A0A3P6SVX8_CYLGO|nr:unnamed protein product [Cylicostephanus goldi]
MEAIKECERNGKYLNTSSHIMITSVEMDVAQQDAKKAQPPVEEKTPQEKEEEKALREFPFYHGFLPREDLLFLLKNEGDYLLRISEVGGGDKTLDADMAVTRRAIILSILTELLPGDTVTSMIPSNVQLKLLTGGRSLVKVAVPGVMTFLKYIERDSHSV